MAEEYYRKNDNQAGNGLLKLVNSLSLIQKISIVIIIAVLGIVFFLLLKWSNRPEYSILYSGLPVEEAANISQKLEDASIVHQVSDDGATIKVESSKLADARLVLAEEGIPFNSVVGFELFDQQFFGLTDFTQQVNYQRALEGELSRTISEISEIDSSRVHLVLSEQELFSDTTTQASASIIIKLTNGAKLENSSVRAIVNLVTNAVKGLDPGNISIVDSEGNLLTLGSEDDTGLSGQQKVISDIENEIENSITTMLIRLFGADNVLVNVKADVNFDRRASEEETYISGEDGNNAILSSSVSKESYDRSESGSNARVPAGTDANDVNLDEENENEEETEDDSAQQKSDIYNREESQIDYGVSRKIETIEYGIGEIEKISVGIFLNSSVSSEQIGDIKSVISAAAGIDPERGDAVTIKVVDFADMEESFIPAQVEEETILQKLSEIGSKIWPGALILALVLILSFRLKGKNVLGRNNTTRKARVLSPDKLSSSKPGIINGEVDFRDGETANNRYEKMSDMLGGGDTLRNFFAVRDSNLSLEEKRERLSEVRKRVLDKNNKNIYPELKELVTMEAEENPEIAIKVIENWLTEKA